MTKNGLDEIELKYRSSKDPTVGSDGMPRLYYATHEAKWWGGATIPSIE